MWTNTSSKGSNCIYTTFNKQGEQSSQHPMDIKGYHRKLAKHSLLLASHQNHTTRISSRHLALINRCCSTDPGSAKKKKKKSFKSTHCMASYLLTPLSLPVATSPSHHPPDEFLIVYNLFIKTPVLIDERTYLENDNGLQIEDKIL